MFDKIMKILTTTEEVDSIDNYRASGPLFELGKSDWYEVDIASRNFAYSKIFRKYDIFYLQRPRSIDLETACLAKKFGLKLVVDYDDDLFNVPVHNPAHLGLHSEEIDCMRDVICASDLVTVSTKSLKDEIEGQTMHKNVQIVPNSLNDSIFELGEKQNFNKVIVWRGSNTHAKDLYSVKDGLNKIIKERSDWTFVFMYYFPFFIEKEKNVIYTDWISPFYNYMNQLKSTYPGIVIHPLTENKFNKSKSNIAWIEATHAGAACVAPDLPEWKQPGIVNYESDNGQDFYLKIKDLMEKIDDREDTGFEDSKKFIESNLILSKVNLKRKELYEKLL